MFNIGLYQLEVDVGMLNTAKSYFRWEKRVQHPLVAVGLIYNDMPLPVDKD